MYHLFGALLLLFQTPTPQKRNGGKRANSGRKSKKHRARYINALKGHTEKAKLRIHREIYEEKMKKVKPTTGRLRTVHECRLLIHAFYKLMSKSLTITSSSDDESELEAVAAPRLVWVPRVAAAAE